MKKISPYAQQLSATYEEQFSKFGASLGSLFWKKNTQYDRFEALSRIGIKSGDSVLDIGCGIGDLYKFFKKKGLNVEYTGFDVTKSMVEVCLHRFPNVDFRQIDILTLDSNKE